MQTNPEIIKKHFQKSIEKYNDNAVVQKITAELMVQRIKNKTFNRVLEIGAGAGLLTGMISKNCSFNNYTANDLIEKSEDYVKKYVYNTEFIAGDFREITFQDKFDLIVSNAVFQWFEDLEEVLEKCSKMLKKNGILLFSTFSPENFNEFHEITGLTLKYKSEDEIRIILEKDFEIIKLETFDYVMNFSSPMEILTHMKNTGVNSLAKTRWTITDIRDFCKNYKKRFSENTLTYSPIIVMAKLK